MKFEKKADQEFVKKNKESREIIRKALEESGWDESNQELVSKVFWFLFADLQYRSDFLIKEKLEHITTAIADFVSLPETKEAFQRIQENLLSHPLPKTNAVPQFLMSYGEELDSDSCVIQFTYASNDNEEIILQVQYELSAQCGKRIFIGDSKDGTRQRASLTFIYRNEEDERQQKWRPNIIYRWMVYVLGVVYFLVLNTELDQEMQASTTPE